MNNISLSAINLIDRSLTNETSMKNMMVLANALPPTHNGMYECNLGSRSLGEMDFAHGFHTKHHAKSLFYMHNYLNNLGSSSEYIERLQSYLNEEGEPIVGRMWFEYDTSRSNFSLNPSVFFDMQPINYQYKNHAYGDVGLWHYWLDQVITPFNTQHTIAENIGVIAGCIEALPRYSFVNHIGVMLGREGELKFCATFNKNNNTEILDYLINRLGIYCAEKSIVVIEKLLEISDYSVVNLDIREAKVSDKFGIECYISRDKPINSLWYRFLTHLEEIDLCTGAQKGSLMEWNFASPITLNKNINIHRKINHTKLVIKEGILQNAKAYLYYLNLDEKQD